MNGKVLIANDDFLAHHGRLGMHWGIKNGPPYPLGMNSKQYSLVSKYGGKVASAGDRAVEKAAKKAKRKEEAQKRRDDRKRRKEEKKIKDVQKAKDRAVSRNSYQDLYAMKDKLSYTELQNAFNRIDLEQKIYAKANPRQKTFTDKMNELMRGVDNVTDWTKSGVRAYNEIALLFNNTPGVKKGEHKRWDYIEKGKGKGD